MRTRCLELGALAVIFASASLVVGCWPFDPRSDCERNLILGCASLTAGSSETGGGGGSTPIACVPSENGAPVGDGCGVFVATGGTDKNTGTKASPVATLSKAFEIAAKKNGRVYACDETFKEALVINSNVELYGGLDCANAWAYVGDTKKTTLTTSADAIPLMITSSASGSSIIDFAVRAVNAVKEGGSSIAVIADGTTAEFVRCEITAGNGATGAAGTPGDPNGSSSTAGAAGNGGKDACSDLDAMGGPDTTLPGGAQIENACGGNLSIGGRGGAGNVLNGSSGDNGQTGAAGLAGTAEPAMGSWDCIVGNGQPGSSGEAGTPGSGATGLGAINPSGFAGTSGGAGTSGKAGQGGGGGGGAKGGVICPGAVSGSGASGGSGGAGGCGGLPGTGGGGGGASIALASLNASITLTDSTLLTSKGGEGGSGGDAQGGGPGGLPGIGGQGVGVSNAGCDGGKGGKGGNGGPGGGGLGGPSIGVAYTGSPITKQGKTTITPGSPGAGGKGGSADVAMNAGAAGAAGEEQLFP